MRSEGWVHWQFKVKAKLAPFCGGCVPNENAGPVNWTGAVARSCVGLPVTRRAAKALVARGAEADRRGHQRTRGRRFDAMVGGVEHDHLGADSHAAVEVA